MKKPVQNSPCQPASKGTSRDTSVATGEPATILLDWYDNNARILAWRSPPDQSNTFGAPDAYRVWLSEIMLQQTQVKTVHAYYLKFLAKWPTLDHLANAELEAVLKVWAGLGYYSRARNLKKCAELVAIEHSGKFPSDQAELKKLPGIGEYTSAAICAIAFGKPVAVVDGNVERIIARRNAIEVPVKQAKREIQTLTQDLVPLKRAGDFAQAMMDLGATICTPKNPACENCPWQNNCVARQRGNQEEYPVKAPVKIKPNRRGAAFVAMTSNGEIFLRRRPMTGMLAGMSEVPTTQWSAGQDGDTSTDNAPFPGDWQHVGKIRHAFTHFNLELDVYYLSMKTRIRSNGRWVKRNRVMAEALSSLIKKVLMLVFDKVENSR